MAIRQQNFNWKPPLGARIDWSHLLSQGLRFMAAVNEGGGSPLDLTNPNRVSSAATWNFAPQGLVAREFSFTNASTTDLNFTTGVFSVAVLYYQPTTLGTGQYSVLFGRDSYISEGANTGWRFLLRNNAGDSFPGYVFDVFANNDFNSYLLRIAGTPAVGTHLLVGTSDGVTRRLYLDGFLGASTTLNPAPASSSANLYNTMTAVASAGVYAQWAWNRTLSASEVQLLYQQPFGNIFVPRKVYGFVPSVGGPTEINVTDTLSISISDASTNAVSSSVTDTLSISVSDASTNAVSSSVTDSLSVSITDASTNAVSSSVSDTLTVSITEASTNALSTSVTDTLTVSLSESVSVDMGEAVPVEVEDSLSVSLSEAASLVYDVPVTDSLSISITEATTSALTTTVTDTLSVSVADTSTNALSTSVADALSVSITDASSNLVSSSVADTLSVSIADVSTVDMFGVTAIDVTDILALSVSDASTLDTTIPAIFIDTHDGVRGGGGARRKGKGERKLKKKEVLEIRRQLEELLEPKPEPEKPQEKVVPQVAKLEEKKEEVQAELTTVVQELQRLDQEQKEAESKRQAQQLAREEAAKEVQRLRLEYVLSVVEELQQRVAQQEEEVLLDILREKFLEWASD